MITKYSLQSLVLLSFLTIFSHLTNAQNSPGGVSGSEVWYMGNWEHIGNGEFQNSAQTDIHINKCGEAEKALFNFNPSIFTKKLCLEYVAPLENTTGRNVFFVGEPEKPEPSFSHLGTLWRHDFGQNILSDSIIRNFFDFNNKNVFTKEIYSDYTSDKNANVNFYHTNNYNIDKKFKSYGQEGETTFYIGKPTQIDPDESYEDNYFYGNFPEFISFPKELSNNERNRIESYLALKYGLTLNKRTSYLSSKNIVFWNDSNNKLFPNRIFGFGKDNTSSLNQLQSESTHLKDHLVSAIDNIVDTNMEKQEQINIPNDHFLVFGDNGGKPLLIKENEHKIKFWEKVWLAQRTGKAVQEFPIHYKLFLTDELVDYLQSNPEESIWLLQDKYIGNDEVSEFDSENIEYYAGEIDWENKIAYFRDVHFDSDQSVYDQFTFGVGPRMIVQAQVQGCKKDKLEIVLDITGGKPEYHIVVESNQGNIEDTTNNNTYTFSVEPDVTYHIIVHDSQGLVAEIEVAVEPWGFDLNLGPDQFLSASQPEITLNAGQGINDPDATYEWYHNDVLLPDTGSTLTIDEIGEYEVVVTSGDLSCTISDIVEIFYKDFEVVFSSINGCDQLHNSLTVTIDGGIPNYTTSLEGVDGTINYAHSGTTTITDIPYGSYIFTVTDDVGEIFEGLVDFVMPSFELDLVSQLEVICSSCLDYPGDPAYPSYLGYNIPFFSHGNLEFTIDASILISSPTATYQWFLNDILISEQPTITFDSVNPFYCYQDSIYNSPSNVRILRVEVSDVIENNCFASESFLFKGYCPNNDNETSQPTQLSQSTDDNSYLKTKVYPNPSKPSATFTYEAIATEQFEATVEVFTVSGAKLYTKKIKGSSSYTLPFSLNSAGMYFIRTTSSLGVKTDKIIIE